MMRQYFKMKQQLKDTILFFRVGDFYETFGEDAKIVSRELGIVLTSRDKERDKTPMAGVPHHSVDTYIARLIRKGYRIAIAEQMEEPSPKKPVVDRAIIRIITPGTILEENLLEDRTNNYLAALVKARKGFGIALVDISTGEFLTTQLEGSDVLSDVITELSRFMVRELIMPESLYENKEFVNRLLEELNLVITPYADYHFDPEIASHVLMDHFNVASLEGFGCANKPLAISASGAVISYLMDTQRAPLANIKTLKTYHITNYMILDATTIKNLELLQNFRDFSTHGTLVEVLDETVTPMGGRLLKKWILQPLLDVQQINDRLDAVEEFVKNIFLRKDLRQTISGIYDLQRIISRLNLNRINPKDLIGLKESLKLLPKIKKVLEEAKSKLLVDLHSSLDTFPEVVDLIERAIVPDPPATLQEGGIIRDGFNEQLDELRKIIREGKKWILDLERRERTRTGIKSLKIGYNKVFGYYIEVTKANLDKVPSDYIRKQTLTNAERFITPELKEFEEKVLSAEDRVIQLEYELFDQVRKTICSYTEKIQKTADIIAVLDVLSTLAEIAVRYNYIKPIVDNSDVIEIKEGRHPVVERLIDEQFVPNDTYMDNNGNLILLVTGPNMAGKSTYVRQVALIVLLSQMGSFVPARYAHIGIIDRIFTRVGAVDDISRRQSTFMVEMLETANILNNATPRSLIILDEIGRGTSTFDGMSIAWAVIEYIHNHIRAKTLFTTHYHELTVLEEILPNVKNYHIAVAERDGKIIFIRRLLRGPSDRSYGIQVAKLAGLPEEVIDRASEIISHIEKESKIIIPIQKIIQQQPSPETIKHRDTTVDKIDSQSELMPEIKVDKSKVRTYITMEKEKKEQIEKEVEQRAKAEREKIQTTLGEFLSGD
ncbi:MAG: DNA mismatch repair protein MutS [Candidatus Asgardarchaeum californiense]|nr:MAG: DNA mismatch repair protein MutS [Candidatus Asgardarchaeum californiense]